MTVPRLAASRHVIVALAVLLLAGLFATGARADTPLSHQGRWITDARGRVVTLHGVNEVTKKAPFHPAGDGFGRDDARFLSENGFNLVRVGVEFQGLMPEPGRIDWGYVNS